MRHALAIAAAALLLALPACDRPGRWRAEVLDPGSSYYAALRDDFTSPVIQRVNDAMAADPRHAEVIADFARTASLDELEALSLAIASLAAVNPPGHGACADLLALAHGRYAELERAELATGRVRPGAVWFLAAGRLPPDDRTVGVMRAELTHPRRATFAAKHIRAWCADAPEHEPLVRSLLTEAATGTEAHPTGAAEAAIRLAHLGWWTPEQALARVDGLLAAGPDEHAAGWIRTKREGLVRRYPGLAAAP